MGLETLGKKLAQLGQDTVSSVQKTTEGVQMSTKIASEKKNLDKLFAQIGEAFFEKNEENAPEGMEELFASVKAVKEAIAGLEEQKSRISVKTAAVCPNCGKEAGKGEKFCSACGSELPEAEEDAATLKKDASEVASEVGDVVNDAADKAKVFFSEFAGKADAFVKGVASRVNEMREENAGYGDEVVVDDLDDDFEEAAEDFSEVAAEDFTEVAAEEAAGAEAPAEEAAAEEAPKAAEDEAEA